MIGGWTTTTQADRMARCGDCGHRSASHTSRGCWVRINVDHGGLRQECGCRHFRTSEDPAT